MDFFTYRTISDRVVFWKFSIWFVLRKFNSCMNMIFSWIFDISGSWAIDRVSDGDWGFLFLDRACRRAFFQHWGKQPSCIETVITAVILDINMGHASLIILTQIPSTPHDFEFMPWITVDDTNSFLQSQK